MILLFLGLAALAGTQDDLPEIVFAYNGSAMTDAFDHCAQGHIWQGLGLLDERGRPPRLAPNGRDLLTPDGERVGQLLRSGEGKVTGVRNADGTIEAYDLGAVRLDHVLSRVTKGKLSPLKMAHLGPVYRGGVLHLVTHGYYRDGNGNGIADPADSLGGGVQLDGGRLYDGLKGEGEPWHGRRPPLPEGAYSSNGGTYKSVVICFDACFSWAGWLGERGFSVADLAIYAPAVHLPIGRAGALHPGVEYMLQSAQPRQVERARSALAARAAADGKWKEDGSGDIVGWIADWPFQRQHREAQSVIDEAVGPGRVVLGLHYFLPHEPLSLSIELESEDEELLRRGQAGLEAAAVKAGFFASDGRPDVPAWILAQPIQEQRLLVEEVLDRVIPGALPSTLLYSPGEAGGGAGDARELPYHVHPHQIGSGGGSVRYHHGLSFAVLDIPKRALGEEHVFRVRQRVDIAQRPVEAPRLCSGIFDFRFPGEKPELAQAGRLTLRLVPGGARAHIYAFDEGKGTWRRLTCHERVDAQRAEIAVCVDELGIYGVFHGPGRAVDWRLALSSGAIAVAALGAGVWVLRTRRPKRS